MPDSPKFVVNDRRKFTAEGELRHDAPEQDSSQAASAATPVAGETGPKLVEPAVAYELSDMPESAALDKLNSLEIDNSLSAISGDTGSDGDLLAAVDMEGLDELGDGTLPPGPTDEQSAEATRAYDATVDRLDTGDDV